MSGAPIHANRGALASRTPELSRRFAEATLDEQDCLIWFGVGRATIERVETGEIEPGDELAERIDRFLKVHGGSSVPLTSATPGAPLTHGGASNGAGDVPRDAAGVFARGAR